MNKYFLKYTDKAEAINDLIAKGILEEVEGEVRQVEGYHFHDVGQIPSKDSTEENPQFVEGYHCNIYTENAVSFDNELQVNTPYANLWD